MLSHALRHSPGSLGLELDVAGWAHIDRVVEGLRARGASVDRVELERIVLESDKQRFAISVDGRFIRAVQGHSIEVALGYRAERPPETLYHGTHRSALESIRAQGLERGTRQHVHLSTDPQTARMVGARRGPPVVLTVSAGRMFADGFVFFRADNGVWLTDRVPWPYLSESDARSP